jgi:hypothetical protein
LGHLSALSKGDFSTFYLMPRMVCIEMVGPHEELCDVGGVMVGILGGEVARAAIAHDYPTEVEYHCVYGPVGHGVILMPGEQ